MLLTVSPSSPEARAGRPQSAVGPSPDPQGPRVCKRRKSTPCVRTGRRKSTFAPDGRQPLRGRDSRAPLPAAPSRETHRAARSGRHIGSRGWTERETSRREATGMSSEAPPMRPPTPTPTPTAMPPRDARRAPASRAARLLCLQPEPRSRLPRARAGRGARPGARPGRRARVAMKRVLR